MSSFAVVRKPEILLFSPETPHTLNVNTNKMKQLIIIFLSLFWLSCSNSSKETKYAKLIEKVKNIEDSISVGEMTIHNAFKQQILAHSGGKFDSLTILKNVYEPNKYVFENCLGIIFGDGNGKKFKRAGISEWNRTLLKDYDSLISSKLSVLDSVNINELFTNHLTAVQEITQQKGKGKWILYFGPMGFQIFGGCDNNSMILDMFGDSWNIKDIDALFAHEIEHLIYGPILEEDPNYGTGLAVTFDEGLAQFFTYKYLNQTIEEALFGEHSSLLIEREKEIFNKLEPYFFKAGDEACPIFKHCERNNNCEFIIDNIPAELTGNICYFLGFRIIQKYEENNGTDSWKDIYRMSISDFYAKSGYKEYIDSIN